MRFTGLIISMAVSILVLISACGRSAVSVPAALISAAPTVAPDQPPTASVVLAVVDLDGAPAASAVVRLSGDQTAEQDSGGDGMASFGGLSTGIYSIQATAGGLSHVRTTFELADSESLELSATLRPVKEFASLGAIRDIGDFRFNDTILGPTIAWPSETW